MSADRPSAQEVVSARTPGSVSVKASASIPLLEQAVTTPSSPTATSTAVGILAAVMQHCPPGEVPIAALEIN